MLDSEGLRVIFGGESWPDTCVVFSSTSSHFCTSSSSTFRIACGCISLVKRRRRSTATISTTTLRHWEIDLPSSHLTALPTGVSSSGSTTCTTVARISPLVTVECGALTTVLSAFCPSESHRTSSKNSLLAGKNDSVWLNKRHISDPLSALAIGGAGCPTVLTCCISQEKGSFRKTK